MACSLYYDCFPVIRLNENHNTRLYTESYPLHGDTYHIFLPIHSPSCLYNMIIISVNWRQTWVELDFTNPRQHSYKSEGGNQYSSSQFSLWFSLHAYQPPAAFLSPFLCPLCSSKCWQCSCSPLSFNLACMFCVCRINTSRLCAIMISVSMKEEQLSRTDWMSRKARAHLSICLWLSFFRYSSYYIILGFI